MSKLSQLFNQLEKHIPNYEFENKNVSNANIGWHIDHTALALKNIVNAVKYSDAAAYSPKFNFKKIIIFTFKKIPRGKAKAPQSVMPIEQLNTENLQNIVAKAKLKIDELSTLLPNQFFIHPYFGNLNVKETIKFLEIHTQHHLNIINDIIKARA